MPNKSHYFNSLIIRSLNFVLFHHRHREGRVLSFFSSRGNWDYPNPPPARECAPHPLVQGEGTLACGRGVGGVPIPTRGHTLRYSVYRSTLCITDHLKTSSFFGREVQCMTKRRTKYMPTEDIIYLDLSTLLATDGRTAGLSSCDLP